MPVLACPDCDHQFRVADLPPGTVVNCTNCKSKLAVPERKLRKRTVVEGHIGGRSDYIDAEDFGPVKVKRTKDKGEIQLNNVMTVVLIVGTTAITIGVLLGGGYIVRKEMGLGGNVRPAALGEVAPDAAPQPPPAPAGVAPAGGPAAPPAAGPAFEPPAADAEVAWAKLVGTWEGEREEFKNGVRARVAARLTFTADRKMVAAGKVTVLDGGPPGPALDMTVESAVEAVELADGYIKVVSRIAQPVPAVDTTYYRFAADGRLVSAKVPRRGDRAEEQTLTYNRAE